MADMYAAGQARTEAFTKHLARDNGKPLIQIEISQRKAKCVFAAGPNKVLKITGSGNIHRKHFYLNLRNPTDRRLKGFMKVALNQWRDAFSVR